MVSRAAKRRVSVRVWGTAAVLGLAAACWFGLGMNRGLLLSSDVKSRCWPWAPSYTPAELQAPVLTDPVWPIKSYKLRLLFFLWYSCRQVPFSQLDTRTWVGVILIGLCKT